MIVIPTYNGYHQLSSLINSLETYGTNGHKVLVVDNGTVDIVSKKFLQNLETYSGPLNLTIEKNAYDLSYETGALIHAVRQHPEEEFVFLMQDSCLATAPNWLSQFEERLTEDTGLVHWIKFKPCLFFCFEPHLAYIDQVAGGHDNVPDGGVFGNYIFTRTSILKDFDSKGYFNFPPKNKIHAESWERLWAILFHINGYKIKSIIDYFSPEEIQLGHYFGLRKVFYNRN